MTKSPRKTPTRKQRTATSMTPGRNTQHRRQGSTTSVASSSAATTRALSSTTTPTRERAGGGTAHSPCRRKSMVSALPPRSPRRTTTLATTTTTNRAASRSPRRTTAPSAAATTSTTQAAATTASEVLNTSNIQGGEEAIQVAIRMRPLNATEGGHKRNWKVLTKLQSITQTTSDGEPLSERVAGRTFFTFDKTFGEDSTTRAVYDSIAKGIVDSAVDGLNGTIFAYGQTSSGKTYTMQGAGTLAQGAAGGTADAGIVHLAAADIFQHIARTPNRTFGVRTSFLEIYNEEVRDLFANNKILQIREDPKRGVFVQSKEEDVVNFESLLAVLIKGEKSRTFASTAMNERSSRSHTIFRITIESRGKTVPNDGAEGDDEEEDEDGAIRISTLNLVDLAGSESVRLTGATGDRQKEGGMINQSLLSLSRVIEALGTPNQFVNFRDSKLTRILQPSLSGNARMAVICCATPSELYLEETRSTLLFASRAKLVKTSAQVNEVLDDRSQIRRLQRELSEAKRLVEGSGAQQVKALEVKAADAYSQAKMYQEKYHHLQASILNGGPLFHNAPKSPAGSPDPLRKRRLSDGDLIATTITTVGQSIALEVDVDLHLPTTLPRLARPGKSRRMHSISPNSKLSLLKSSLAAKNDSLTLMQQDAKDNQHLMDTKDSELVAFSSINDSLQNELSQANEKLARLSAQLEDQHQAHEQAMADKSLQLDEIKAQASKDLVAIQEAAANLESEMAGLQSEKAELERLNEMLGTEMSELSSHLVESKEKLESSQALAQQTGMELIATKELVQSLDSDKAKLESERAELAQQNIMLIAEKSELSSQLTEITENYETSQARAEETSKELQTMREAVESLESKEVTMILEKAVLSQQVESLVSENASLTSQLAETKNQLDNSQGLAEQTDNELAAAKETSKSLEVEKVELESEKADLINTIDSLDVEISELSSKLSLANENYKLTQALADESHVELVSTKEVVLKLESEIADTETKLGVATLEIEKVTTSLGSVQDDLDKATDRVSSVEASNLTLEAEVEEYKDKLAIAVSSWESSKSFLEAAQQKINQLEASFQYSQQAKSTVEDESNRLKIELATANKNIFDFELLQVSTATELKASREMVEGLQSKLAEAEALHQTLMENNEMANARSLQLESNLKDIAAQLQTAAEERDAARTELEARVGDLQNVREEKTNSDSLISDLKLNVQELKQREIELKDANATMLEEKSSLLAQLDTLTAQLQTTAEERDAARVELETRVGDLHTVQEEKTNSDSLISDLKLNVQELKQREIELEDANATILLEKCSLQAQLELQKATLEDHRTQLQSRTDELLNVHDQIENLNGRLNESRQTIRDLEDEIMEKTTMLTQSTSKANIHSTVIADLERTIDTLIQEKQALQDKAQSTDDLRLLLASTNESLTVAREAESIASHQLEEMKKQLVNVSKLLSEREDELRAALSNEDSSTLVELLRQELQRERDDRARAEAELRDLMGEEQRALIHEADCSMQTLRGELSIAQELLKRAQEEAYAARHHNEELREGEQKAKERASEMENRAAALQEENSRLRTTVDSAESGRRSDVAKLTENLNRTKDAVVALQKRLALAEGAKRNMESLEDEKRQLALKVKQLQEEVQLTNKIEKENAHSDQKLVAKLMEQIETKEKRIQKLEKSKLTKEAVEFMTRTKAEKKEYKKKFELAEKEIAQLRHRLERAGTVMETSAESSEITALRFNQQALESQLRKASSHCQHLEDEKARCLQALRSKSDADIVKAVVGICDHVASLEKECDSLTKKAIIHNEMERLKVENSSLQRQCSEYKKKYNTSWSSEKELQQTALELKEAVAQARGKAEKVVRETNQKIMFLEQENLELMNDLKDTRKKYQSTKSELNVLRVKDSDDTTFELAKLRSQYTSSAVAPRKTPVRKPKLPPSTPTNTENAANASSPVPPKSRGGILGSLRKQRAPGLGEAGPPDGEITQECKQS